MRIGMDALPLSGEKSGVGYYTEQLLRALERVEGKNEYVLFSTRDFDSPFSDSSRFRKRIAPLLLGYAWMQVGQPVQIAKERLDLYHGPNFVVPLAAPCPTVITIHDLSSFILRKTHKWTNNLIQRVLVPPSARRSRLIIAVSDATRSDVVRILGIHEEKIRVIPEAVDGIFSPVADNESRRRVMRRLGLPEKFILFVGTLEPRKNIPTLLEAFAYLIRRGDIKHQLVLAGVQGWGGRSIQKKVRFLGIEERVKFTGYVAREDLPMLYSMADSFVYPSLYEGFGLPPLEAMACGTPVIVSDGSALSSVVAEAGIRVDPNDVHGLAQAMRNVLMDKRLRSDLIKRGMERVKCFSWDATARETLALYEEAAFSRGD
ncbi:MAG: glycosyltransferase family 4 protein [Deltaproteobacteria bacterium]|nr:glycosyltransferase family 4 protein [Deltaproteobacteria bacterium]